MDVKNEILIKPASKSDCSNIMTINDIVHLWHVQNHSEYFKDSANEDLCEYFNASLNDESYMNIFAYSEDKIVGYIQAEKRILKGSPFTKPSKNISINIIVVLPEYRKRKVGEKLYQYILKYAEENQFNRIDMNYWEGNENAPAFFKKMGFKHIRHFMYIDIG